MKRFMLGTILVSSLVAVACSSSSGGSASGGGSDGSGASGSTSSTTTSSSVSTTTSSSGAGGGMGAGGGGACSMMGSAAKCQDCCANQEMAGYEAFATHLVTECGCNTGAPCLAKCDTMTPATDVCTAPGMVNLNAMNQDCVMCINTLMQNEACLTAFGNDCKGDAACMKFVMCASTCPQM